MTTRSVGCAVALLLAASGAAFGQAAVKDAVPKEMTWTAYDAGSSGFDTTTAIARQFKQSYGAEVRVLPSGSDTGRLAPVKVNRATIAQMGIGTYFAQEGVFEFGTRSWGPQPVRLLMTASGCNGLGLAVAKDSGAREIKDLKGKRLGIVVGSPALTQGALALLAFAGLGESDVTVVPFASNNAMWKGFIDNEADIALTSTLSGQVKEAATSARGVIWPALPAEDKAGWARVHKKAPYFVARKVTCGAGGLSPTEPVAMSSYPYPIYMTFADRSEVSVQAITRGMIETYDSYKNAASGADGLALTLQTFTWLVPYHDGAIRAFREKGVWTEAAQKHNDGLIKRQRVLIDAWRLFGGAAPADDQSFAIGWTGARVSALRNARMEAAFE
jgi:TRAP transporter TAXI family solute receptor